MFCVSKLLVLLALICLGYCKEEAHMTPEQTGQLIQSALGCVAETGASPDSLFQVRDGKFSEDPKFQNFIYCVLRRNGVASKDGHIKIEKALDRYPENVDKEGVRKAFDECNKENGNSPTETAFRVARCFHAATPVHLTV